MPRNVPPIDPKMRKAWLNIVFDLNGVLCHCDARSAFKGKQWHRVEDNVFSNREPTLIGTKAVFVRPNLREFLREVNQITNRVVFWSSMLRKTVEPIVAFLCQDNRQPFEILGQENCKKIEITPGRFLVQGGNPFKPLFLKVLNDHLFTCPEDPQFFNDKNTILIDDSPQKSVLNENGNGIFLEKWIPHERGDNVLMGSLAPWLKRLHKECQPGCLREYVDEN